MRTLNQILTRIEAQKGTDVLLSNGTYLFGDPWEWGASNTIAYPLLGVRLISQNINGNIHAMGLNLFFCDLVHKDESNEQSVLSDMSVCALRFYSELKLYLEDNYPATVGASSGLTPFTERFDDEVSGVEMNINIEQHFDQSTCN